MLPPIPLSLPYLHRLLRRCGGGGGQLMIVVGRQVHVDAISSGVLNWNQTLVPVGLDHEQ